MIVQSCSSFGVLDFSLHYQVSHVSCWFTLWHNSSYRPRETGGEDKQVPRRAVIMKERSLHFLPSWKRWILPLIGKGEPCTQVEKIQSIQGRKKSSQAPTPMAPLCRLVFLNSDVCLLLQVRVLYHLCSFSSKQSIILYYVFIPGSYTQWMLNRWMTVW